MIDHARGEGAMWAAGLRADQNAVALRDAMLTGGVICRAINADTLTFCPPLVITDEQIDRIVDVLSPLRWSACGRAVRRARWRARASVRPDTGRRRTRAWLAPGFSALPRARVGVARSDFRRARPTSKLTEWRESR